MQLRVSLRCVYCSKMDLADFLKVMGTAQILLPFLLFMLLVPLERAFPRIAPVPHVAARWRLNALVALLGIVATLFASFSLGPSLERAGLAIMPFSVGMWSADAWVKLAVSVLIMDFLAYVLHFLGHKLGFLWKLHRIHHSDDHVDASTGLRHHPLEGVVALCFLTVLYTALGLPLVAIAVFGVLFAAHSVFSHSNIRISPALDRWLRWVIVTPDMHRIHHSTDPGEYNGNYGQVFPWWDWMFRTLKTVAFEHHDRMKLGLSDGNQTKKQTAAALLLEPFRSNRLEMQLNHRVKRPAKAAHRSNRVKRRGQG